MRNLINPFLLFLLMLLTACLSCKQSGTVNENNSESRVVEPQVKSNIYFATPQKGQTFKDNELLSINLALRDSATHLDSIQLLLDGKLISTTSTINKEISIDLTNTKLGNRNIEAIGYYSNNTKDHAITQITVLLQKEPAQYTYQVINVYPHDKNAYTQGLQFDNGDFYESTGLYGQSSLRKVKLSSGEILKSFSLPNNIFGEGITLFDNKIIQISWREQVAFLYDKETFQILNKYYYPIQEGWGITYDGTNLIMSDGSPYLYFLDKEYFTELARLEVFDETGPVKDLNELEYIEGEIWANVYTTDYIVRINPKTGAVTGKFSLAGLLKPEDKNNNTDVLNGIAYDTKNKKIFVTGKNWPKLFEIKVLPKK